MTRAWRCRNVGLDRAFVMEALLDLPLRVETMIGPRAGSPHGVGTIEWFHMLRRSLFRLSIVMAFAGLVVFSLVAGAQNSKRGRKYKAPPPTARIEVTVLRDVNGKPIENAAVIFHLVGEKGNMELKTNEDGKAVIDVLPLNSSIRLQVIAKGFQTYGQDFKIDKDQIAIEAKMRRPGEQYSIYKNHPEAGGSGKDAAPDTNPDAKKDKPDDSAKQPDAQANPREPK